MCGLSGFLTRQENIAEQDASFMMKLIANNMSSKINHRGPDDSGIWVDAHAGIVLAHRRLSIIDLSAAGHQPMVSKSGRYVIVFNGEIYNHLDIRCELELCAAINEPSKEVLWEGHSDTETLLAGFQIWGIESTLKKTVGMFAIAIWDRDEKLLTLARDRLGEKPLYYGFQKNTFLFGSELKALKAHPDFLSEIDRDVLCLYLRHSNIPAPYSIYKGIKKLLPGTYIQLRLGDTPESNSLSPKYYWNMKDVVTNSLVSPFVGSDAEAVCALDSQLKNSIRQQMVSDVPLGAFLSGGVDSSVIVALMQSQSAQPVRTFSIGFDEPGYNEAKYAMAIAKHLHTDHTELYVSYKDAINVIPLLPEMYDEPFADSSQIPTYLISKLARQHVKVSLSGDGGDELFCGYNRYKIANNWENIEKVPMGLRRVFGHAINSIQPEKWDGLFQQISKLKKMPDNMGGKLNKLARVIQSETIEDAYSKMLSEIEQPEQIVLGLSESKGFSNGICMDNSFNDARQYMMFMDAMTYLPDDILVKVDRAAMASGLETRVPFLDHHLVEFAWQLPMNMKMRDGKSKWILREVLNQYVPRQLVERPKAGFGIPLGTWLRGPLSEWVESLLNEQRLYKEGYFNVSFVRDLWRAHLSGQRNNQSLLWNILMFQAWLEKAN
jgi:asparagine synthase (glutamine-hydrolysing)